MAMSSGDSDLPFLLKRLQFPILLAFAMTINKSQGQTFDRVGIFLPRPVFSHGQLYVAFSRAISSQEIRFNYYGTANQGKINQNSNKTEDKEKVYTQNIVYREVLG